MHNDKKRTLVRLVLAKWLVYKAELHLVVITLLRNGYTQTTQDSDE